MGAIDQLCPVYRPMPIPAPAIAQRIPMLNLVSATSHPTNLSARALTFLEHYPALSQSLIEDCETDLNRVATIIEPMLDASQRCAVSHFYVQAATTGRTAFLMTNLPEGEATTVLGLGTTWLMGRNSSCAIVVPKSAVSRCHAVIGFSVTQGFYITDVGSKNGTFVNRRRLQPQEQKFLRDGDLIELSRVAIEFFISGGDDYLTRMDSTQS
jgi:hypothetical protein